MKREIKFRAWDRKEKRWISVCGFKIQDGQMFAQEWRNEDNRSVKWTYIPEEFELMQYTGLKDKNGKEIYEGDIITLPFYGQAIIVWNENICAFQYAYHAIGKGTSVGNRMTNTLYDSDSEIKYEVTGNIYENPESLATKTKQPK